MTNLIKIVLIVSLYSIWIYVALPLAETDLGSIALYPYWVCLGTWGLLLGLTKIVQLPKKEKTRQLATFGLTAVISCGVWLSTVSVMSHRRYEDSYQALETLIESVAETGEAPNGYCVHLSESDQPEITKAFEIIYTESEFGEQFFLIEFESGTQFNFEIFHDDTCWRVYGYRR